MNKYVKSICLVESKNTIEGFRRAPTFVIELDGRFYRDGLLKTEENMKLSRSLVQMYDKEWTEAQDGRMLVYLSKVSI